MCAFSHKSVQNYYKFFKYANILEKKCKYARVI